MISMRRLPKRLRSRCGATTRHAMSMSGAGERSLQIAWRDVDGCEDAGGSDEDRRRGSASVGGIPAAIGYRDGMIQSIGSAILK